MGPCRLALDTAVTRRGVSIRLGWRRIGRAVSVPIMRWIQCQAAKRAMMELDDRLLRDIGLTRPELPVIFITGHHDDDVEQRAFAEGAAFFIRKPFDAGELLRATRLAFGESSGKQREDSVKQER